MEASARQSKPQTRTTLTLSLKKLIFLVFTILTTLSAQSAFAVIAGGMASIARNFPSVPGGYSDMEFQITVTKDPGYNGRTYWAHQFQFGPDGGYIGLQRQNGDAKGLVFSIWGATSWTNGSGSCGHFSHEGSGVGCGMNYPWQEGVLYKLKVARTAPSAWTGSIIDTRTGQQTTIATIRVPDNYGGLVSLGEWVENYAQGNEQHESCDAVPTAVAAYGIPTANGGSVLPSASSAWTYGPCESIAQTTCTADQTCTLIVSPRGVNIKQDDACLISESGLSPRYVLARSGTVNCSSSKASWKLSDGRLKQDNLPMVVSSQMSELAEVGVPSDAGPALTVEFMSGSKLKIRNRDKCLTRTGGAGSPAATLRTCGAENQEWDVSVP
ncbi:DUF3472 domain-containing protein [Pseudomonas akapageensis]|uniref:DUF3472 domain-containing protein n=1 Tax=Pseudomonas akapageensis TaxID=2609961 RepID=UPI00140A8A1B|nr:DUF3472 domain-containing protein [Pseudomonas akapageensis]